MKESNAGETAKIIHVMSESAAPTNPRINPVIAIPRAFSFFFPRKPSTIAPTEKRKPAPKQHAKRAPRIPAIIERRLRTVDGFAGPAA